MARHRDPETSVLTFWRADDRILRSHLTDGTGRGTDRVVEGIRLQAATPARHSPVQMVVAPAVGGRVVALSLLPTRLLLFMTTHYYHA
jgi:hypothetical protein